MYIVVGRSSQNLATYLMKSPTVCLSTRLHGASVEEMKGAGSKYGGTLICVAAVFCWQMGQHTGTTKHTIFVLRSQC